jgi:hypothetical protein
MDKDKMRAVACLMLVDMAADGRDIKNMAIELRSTYAFASPEQFKTVCRKISAAYKE